MSGAFENAVVAYLNACHALALLVTPETLAEYAHRWRVPRELAGSEFGREAAFDLLNGLIKSRCDRATLRAMNTARLVVEKSVRHQALHSESPAGAMRQKSDDGAHAVPAG